VTPPVVVWRQIESPDYRQYVANLRAVECPDWLVRDIIVADIDDLYRQKSGIEPANLQPWLTQAARGGLQRARTAKLKAVSQEKRGLVKALLGFEWEDDSEKIWNQNPLTSLADGFLPDDKAVRVELLRDEYEDRALAIREAANFILIDEDRAKLRSLYEQFQNELAAILDASQLDEISLRWQQNFLVENDIHFDGMNISTDELRSFLRRSKSIKDITLTDFVPERRLSEADQARRKSAIEAEAATLFGPARFADFQRAQDFDFRQALEFGHENALEPSVAAKIYDLRRNVLKQAEEIQRADDLSPAERATALAALKATAFKTLSPVLGDRMEMYLAGPGDWLQSLPAGTDAAAP